jgi:receptor protein-tyrosine kinase
MRPVRTHLLAAGPFAGGRTLDLNDVVGAIRRRWRIIVGAVALSLAIAGVYLYRDSEGTDPPDRYAARTNILIPSDAPDAEWPAEDDFPRELVNGQAAVALSEEVRNAALSASGLPPNSPAVALGYEENDEVGVVTLNGTGTDPELVRTVVENWTDAYVNARTDIMADLIDGERQGTVERIRTLRERRDEVRGELVQRLGELPTYTTIQQPGSGGGTSSVVVPQLSGSVPLETELLAYELGSIETAITAANIEYGDIRVNAQTPGSFAEVTGEYSPRLISASAASTTLPPVAIVLAGIALGLVAAVVRDRVDRSIRKPKEAVAAFGAPVLATLPAPTRKRDFSVLVSPDSSRSEAFRKLAATCITTDRLPSAIMVSTPEGDAHEEVAANFAAALASLGVQVALVSTSPRQSWFLEPFTALEQGAATFPELLAAAHDGRLNGQVPNQLAATTLTDKLLLVPPGDTSGLELPLDGLPPLLDSFSESGVDVTVIAGPALLSEASATIVAWSTRTVLWAVQSGTLTRDVAADAAARLELAGVSAFGVALVDAPA